jgi:hydrogenase/urease accessory protein HupE
MMRRSLTAFVALLVGAWWPAAHAHEVRPGYLEIRDVGGDAFDVLWKVPASGEYRLGMYVRLPAKCTGAPTSGSFMGGAFIERWRASCPGGLIGERIAIDGLSATRTDVLARIARRDGTTQVVRLTPEATSFEVTASPDRLEVAKTFFTVGVRHILLGVDHLLFVLGLMLIVANRWMLVKTITAFTVAHSITLAIATLGYASAPVPPLNAAIALSILFLGPEIVRAWRGQTSFTIQHPWVVAFAFGLLHGFGFASGLTTMGLPQTEIPVALLFFNLGVEAGQLAFVLAVVLLERAFRTLEIRWPRWAQLLPGYVVGSLGAFWMIQRTLMMLGVVR